MDQDRELRSLDKTIMAEKLHDSFHTEPEMWYKVRGKAGPKEAGEVLPYSEDDSDLSQGRSLPRPILASNSLIPIPDENASEEATPSLSPRKVTLPRSKPSLRVKPTDSSTTLHALEKDYRDLQQAHDTTSRDLKATSRENRDQSLELRDLKRRLAKLHEQTAQLREENGLLHDAYQTPQARSGGSEKLSNSERTKYSEQFDMLENHISHLQHERHKRETHMEFLTEQTREANDGKERLEAEMRRLQKQTKDLSANLTECKDDLLRLQPTSQVSDSEISEHFSNLDQQIAGWVDDNTEESTVLEERIAGIKTVDDLPELLRMFSTSDHLRLVKRYPDSQPMLLRYFIHCYLQTFILSSDVFLFGLDERNIKLLQGIEEGMKQLEPRRDSKTLRNWRSETLRGLLQMPAFITEQTRQAHQSSTTLATALSSLISSSPDDTNLNPPSISTIHSQIILPAIHLATKLHLSTTIYRLLFHPFSRSAGHHDDDHDATISTGKKARPAYQKEIPHSSMIDITTHKVIRPDSVLKVAQDGRIGEDVLVVSPALVRDRDQKDDGNGNGNGSGKGKVMVCKPTVLVKLDEPMGKRSRGIRALGAWTPSWFGGDEEVE